MCWPKDWPKELYVPGCVVCIFKCVETIYHSFLPLSGASVIFPVCFCEHSVFVFDLAQCWMSNIKPPYSTSSVCNIYSTVTNSDLAQVSINFVHTLQYFWPCACTLRVYIHTICDCLWNKWWIVPKQQFHNHVFSLSVWPRLMVCLFTHILK